MGRVVPCHTPSRALIPRVSFEEAMSAKGTKFGKAAVIALPFLCRTELPALQ